MSELNVPFSCRSYSDHCCDLSLANSGHPHRTSPRLHHTSPPPHFDMARISLKHVAEEWYEPLYRFALSLSKNPDDAMDLTQSAFYKLTAHNRP